MSAAIAPVTGSPLTSPADDRVAKIKSAAREFETILVKQLLTAAKMGGDGKGGYGDMAVDAFAQGVEKGGGLGLADQIAHALSGQPGSAPAAKR